MGYCGAPSKGCEICRSRKIKCDRTGTPCNNCIVNKRTSQCTYRNQLDLNFRIIAHSTLAAQVRKDQLRRRERKNRKLGASGPFKKGSAAASSPSPSKDKDNADNSSDEGSQTSSRSPTPEPGAGVSPLENVPVGPNGVREYKWDYFTVEDWEKDEGVPSTKASSARGTESVAAVTRTPSPTGHQAQAPAPVEGFNFLSQNWNLDPQIQPQPQQAQPEPTRALPRHPYPIQTQVSPAPMSDGTSSADTQTPVTYPVHGTPVYQFSRPTVPVNMDDTAFYPQTFIDPSLQQASFLPPYQQQSSLSPPHSHSHSHSHSHTPTHANSAYHPPTSQHGSSPASMTNAIPRTSLHPTYTAHRKSNSLNATPTATTPTSATEPMHTCHGGTGSVEDGIEIWGCKACLAAGHFAWHVRDGVTLYPVKNEAGVWGCGQCWAWMERFTQNQQLYAALGLQ